MKLRLLCLAVFSSAALQAEDLRLLVLDPLAAKNACACLPGYAQRDYDAFAGYLGEALKTTVTPQFGVVLAGKPALVIGKQTEIEHAAKSSGRKLTRVAMLTDLQGATNLRGLFVVRAEDAAKSLADLKGRKILFGPDGADEKRDAAFAALKAAGVPLPDKVEARETCSQTVLEVAENKADAAVVSDFVLPLLEGCGTIDKGELRIIGRTADVPFIALYVTEHFPANTLAELQKALDKLAANAAMLDKLESTKGFVAAKQNK